MRMPSERWEALRAKRNAMINDIREILYFHIHLMRGGKNEPMWRGCRIVKMPNDLIMYAEAMWQNHPDWIIETGTAYGGSALFLADMLELTGGKGKVLTIDIEAAATDKYGHGGRFNIVRPSHPRIEYITGSSVDPAVVQSVRDCVSGNVMVILDSDHSLRHVREELRLYSDIVTVGQFLVTEDSFSTSATEMIGAGQAVAWFLKHDARYVHDPVYENKYLVGISRGGWLRRTT